MAAKPIATDSLIDGLSDRDYTETRKAMQ